MHSGPGHVPDGHPFHDLYKTYTSSELYTMKQHCYYSSQQRNQSNRASGAKPCKQQKSSWLSG